MASAAPPDTARFGKPGSTGETLFHAACFGAATLLLVTLGGVVVSLAIGGWPAIEHFGFGFLTSSEWNPVTEVYGAAGPVVGTLVTALLALVMALPLAIGVAVFLVEFCPRPVAQPVAIAVELLAGIPSIVYGMWGLFVLAPWFAEHVQLPLMMEAEPGSWQETLFSGIPNGANIFTASVILAIMILPYMAAVFRELFMTVPAQLREAAYGLGCTPFEVIRAVVIPYVRRGMVGVIMLGLGRALGETMAVTFIIGNAHGFPDSVFASGSTIASTIANEFAEATSDMHSAALVALGLVLFLITFGVLAIARALLGSQRH
ncbi:phosphate ABC transporter permease subunit PstC [Rhizorhabdus wittichii]|jgi:phosphate transport system permease protein|uniref:Phosphate transport system permease protein n=2 Tax=Rhizorhabdus wittichii TaxID=160791 RepID=A0A9J9HA00_RHIWR|nr:phosphate ABC transporter permease subunit PstC [Rhizorhabdus wittichii]ABQ67469.1 phosphate ABC transporter, inner membrane subunit PstC [Rhizorhabdus wittichii RW1]ARR55754.1 phosphate ABC transporter permease subunit PstC [Rhizorhabdus wittichii DC-6]QTH22128.1 phosphate ABC transporter permease subunit PstC [Rhizorhabdus wittichii]